MRTPNSYVCALAVAVFTAALSMLPTQARADGVGSGKGAAEQCVKFQKARSDKQIHACCADLLDGMGDKMQKECVAAAKDMAGSKKDKPKQ